MNGVALIILDGWGLAPEGPGNCVRLAATPNVDRLAATRPYTELAASGRAVGLPEESVRQLFWRVIETCHPAVSEAPSAT